MKNIDPPDVSRDSDKFMLRLPDGMRLKIAADAKANGRSMNAEIVSRLQAPKVQSASAMAWPDLVDALQKEAAERGATITITIGK